MSEQPNNSGAPEKAIPVSGVWLRRAGRKIIVAVEVAGQWRDVIVESSDAEFSHIAEIGGIQNAPETRL